VAIAGTRVAFLLHFGVQKDRKSSWGSSIGDDYEVVGEAAHGVEAVEKFKELSPDLVTMDIVMPFKSGIEATKDILNINKEACVVMCSALGQESLVMEAIEAGAKDFIVKPFKAEDVIGVVQKVLA